MMRSRPSAAQRAHEFLDGHGAGGVEMTRILEPQDDDAQVGVRARALDLRAKQFGGGKKQLALDMHNRDRRMLASALARLGEVAFLVELVLDQRRAAGFAQIQHDGNADADENGDMQRQHQRGEQRDDKHQASERVALTEMKMWRLLNSDTATHTTSVASAARGM
jgi:hypothetical protein